MTANEIKDNINLADYVRSCGIELTKHGRNDLKGLCPFHDDKNPSLIITPKKGLFHCPPCGAGGSVIDFTAKIKNISIKDAIKELSENHQLPSRDAKEAYHGPSRNAKGQAEGRSAKQPSAQKTSLPVEREAELLERVISFYEKSFANSASTDLKLPSATDGRKYMEERGITDAGLFSKHRIGYADGSLLKALPKTGKIIEDLKTLGVLLDNGKERFLNCVVFPVFDTESNVTTLYGRGTGAQKKHVYLLERPTGLFNVGVIKTYPEIVLVESAIDALSLEMAGLNNVVSIQGTNGLTDESIANFASCGVRKVTLMMDGDKAGERSTNSLNERLSERFETTIIRLPEEHDPNSYLVEHDSKELQNLFSLVAVPEAEETTAKEKKEVKSANIAEHEKPQEIDGGFAISCGLRRYEVLGLEKKQRSLKATIRAVKSGKLHVDTIDFYSSRQRRQLSQDLCGAFEESPDTVNGDLSKILQICERRNLNEKSANFAKNGETEPEKRELTAREKKEAEKFGKLKSLIGRILDDYEKCGLVGEKSNKLLCYLAMTSRKMLEPLSVLILSSSGAGKTALQDTALAFCPPEDLVKLTSLSAKALFYKEQNSLKHKVLAIEEGAGAEDATYAIRNLISSDGLTSEVAVRDPQTGKLTTMANTVDGPTSVFCTTTDPEVDPETKSRFLVTGIDESREQTRRILDFQKKRHSLDGLQVNLEKEKIIELHRNFQRLLKPLAIVNPHIDQLSYSDDRLQGRRAQPQYLNIINAVAFLRQMSKQIKYCEGTGKAGEKKIIEFIEVDEQDINIGNALAVEILGKTLDELSIPARDLLDLIDKMLSARIADIDKKEGRENGTFKRDLTFTRRELREFTGWTKTRTQIHLKELMEMEYVIMESGRPNMLQHYKLFYDGQGKDGKPFML